MCNMVCIFPISFFTIYRSFLPMYRSKCNHPFRRVRFSAQAFPPHFSFRTDLPCSQFHQHFTSSFFANILTKQNIQTWKYMHEKAARKMLMKLSPERIVEVAAHVRLLRTLVDLGHVSLHPKKFQTFDFFGNGHFLWTFHSFWTGLLEMNLSLNDVLGI